MIAAVDDRLDRLGAAATGAGRRDLERVGHRPGSLGTTKPDDAAHRLLYDAGMATALHDPATYTTGFPYERFAELRDHDPVSHHEHPAWTRGYCDLATPTQRVSRDWTAFRNAQPVPARGPGVRRRRTSLLLISLDPPEHTKLRKLISSGFTPRRINDLAAHVKDRADQAIDAVADRGECDLVRDIAL